MGKQKKVRDLFARVLSVVQTLPDVEPIPKEGSFSYTGRNQIIKIYPAPGTCLRLAVRDPEKGERSIFVQPKKRDEKATIPFDIEAAIRAALIAHNLPLAA